MRLILRTPALEAHTTLRYIQWRAVISAYVARRTGGAPDGVFPQTVGNVSLAIALTAYAAWLDRPGSSLPELLDESMGALRDYAGCGVGWRSPCMTLSASAR